MPLGGALHQDQSLSNLPTADRATAERVLSKDGELESQSAEHAPTLLERDSVEGGVVANDASKAALKPRVGSAASMQSLSLQSALSRQYSGQTQTALTGQTHATYNAGVTPLRPDGTGQAPHTARGAVGGAGGHTADADTDHVGATPLVAPVSSKYNMAKSVPVPARAAFQSNLDVCVEREFASELRGVGVVDIDIQERASVPVPFDERVSAFGRPAHASESGVGGFYQTEEPYQAGNLDDDSDIECEVIDPSVDAARKKMRAKRDDAVPTQAEAVSRGNRITANTSANVNDGMNMSNMDDDDVSNAGAGRNNAEPQWSRGACLH